MGKKIKITQPEDVRQGMEQRICAEISMDSEIDTAARRLALALYHGATCLPQFRKEVGSTVIQCLKQSDEDIVKQAFVMLFGEREADDLIQVLSIRLNGPVSEAVFRTPFHSSKAIDYVERIMIPTIYRWIRGSGCPVELLESLTDPDLVLPEDYDVADRLALELRRRDPVIAEAVQQILNQEPKKDRRKHSGKLPPITREILQGVIRSGHTETIRTVKRLLLDKSQPTHIRELVLMTVDEGSVEIFVDFLDLIYQEKLYRSPTVSRIIDTWLWLGFGALEPQMAELILRDCLMFLKDPALCLRTVDQGDMQNVHLALWALAVRNIRQIGPILWDLLHSQKNSQKISAINFISNVQHDYLDYSITRELLEQAVATASQEEPYGEAMELIAWLIPNLIPQDFQEKIPGTSQERQHLFVVLEKTLELVGKEERIFCGKPFAWTICRMGPELVVDAMLRLTEITKDRSMVRSLARKLDYFTPKQRGFFYEYLLDPLHWKEDDHFLQDHQNDRSSSNRQLIAAKLALVQRELEQKGEALHRM